MEVGARIRSRRKAAGLTQGQLGEAIGVTFQQVQKYEKGVNRVSATTLTTIARALGCSLAFLIGEAEDGKERHVPAMPSADEEAVELIGIYAQIPSSKARSAFLALAKALARQAETPPSLAA